jgi:hypothetical protein
METPGIPSGFKDKYGPNLFDGLPYRGKVFDRKEDDPDYKQPIYVEEVFIKQLNLSEPKDMETWSEICQKVADGVAIISFEEKIYDKDIKSWRVLIRWMEPSYTNPEGV